MIILLHYTTVSWNHVVVLGCLSMAMLNGDLMTLEQLYCVGAMLSLRIDQTNLWSVQHSALCISQVILTSWTSLCLSITKSIRCHCLDLGCIQVVLYLSAWQKMVLLMHSMCSAHLPSRSRPLCSGFPHCGARTAFQLLLTLPTLALKSPKIMSLSLGDVSFMRWTRSS